MITEKTIAFPIRRRNFKEVHVMITLFTKSRGLLPAVGYGVGNFGSKRAGNFDALNLCEIELEHRRGVWTIRGGKALHVHPRLKNDLSKSVVCLSAASFLLDHLPQEVPHPAIFQLFTEFLEFLEEKSPLSNDWLKIFGLIFRAKTLFLLGYFPHLRGSLCHPPEDSTKLAEPSRRTYTVFYEPFSIQCSSCLNRPLPLTAATIEQLLKVEEQFFEALSWQHYEEGTKNLLQSLVAHITEPGTPATRSAPSQGPAAVSQAPHMNGY